MASLTWNSPIRMMKKQCAKKVNKSIKLLRLNMLNNILLIKLILLNLK